MGSFVTGGIYRNDLGKRFLCPLNVEGQVFRILTRKFAISNKSNIRSNFMFAYFINLPRIFCLPLRQIKTYIKSFSPKSFIKKELLALEEILIF